MEGLSTNDHLAHQRWLIDRGLINDLHKDTLFMYGSIVHKDVQAVHVKIKPEDKVVEYRVYVPADLIKQSDKFCKLKESTSVFGLWKFRRMLKAEGNLDLKFMVDKFVKDYCGPQWKANVQIEDFVNYEDGLENEKEEIVDEREVSSETDKSLD